VRRRGATAALALAACSVSAHAQRAFCALTTGPGANWAVVDAPAQQPSSSGSSTFLTGVNDVLWNDESSEVYFSRSSSAQVSRCDLSSGAPVFSTLYAAGSACYGLGLDSANDVLFTLRGPPTRELVAIDVAPLSPTYGQVLGATGGLGSLVGERWGLSRSARRAVIAPLFVTSTAPFVVVDTERNSPGFLTHSVGQPLTVQGGGLPTVAGVAVTSDDRWALFVVATGGVDEVLAFDLQTQAWLPGFLLSHNQSKHIALASDDRTLLLAGSGSGGWAGKLTLGLPPSGSWTYAPLLGPAPVSVTALALSRDGATGLAALAAPARLTVFNVASGVTLSTSTLPNSALALDVRPECTADVAVYCTAGTSGAGCAAALTAVGVPRASATSGFVLQANQVEGQRQGLIFYGVSGRIALAWGLNSGFYCVKQPTQRTPPQSSGGSLGQCNGALAFDWSAFVAATPAALGAPFVAGDTVQAQAWYRDPPSPKSTLFSDALEFVLCP